MRTSAVQVGLVCCLTTVILGGCISGGPTALDFGLRHVATSDARDILIAAEATLPEMGFSLVQSDDDEGMVLYTDGKTTAGVSDRRGFSSKMKQRRIVELRLQRVSDGHKLFCRVSIQRQTTQAHRALAYGSSGDDRPGQTAIDRDAATTIEQNTVWQTAHRDKSTEQAILMAITARLGGRANQE